MKALAAKWAQQNQTGDGLKKPKKKLDNWAKEKTARLAWETIIPRREMKQGDYNRQVVVLLKKSTTAPVKDGGPSTHVQSTYPDCCVPQSSTCAIFNVPPISLYNQNIRMLLFGRRLLLLLPSHHQIMECISLWCIGHDQNNPTQSLSRCDPKTIWKLTSVVNVNSESSDTYIIFNCIIAYPMLLFGTLTYYMVRIFGNEFR